MLTKKDKEIMKQVFQEGFKNGLRPVFKKLREIEKKLDLTISYFDRDVTDHTKRIKRVENHLNLPPIAD